MEDFFSGNCRPYDAPSLNKEINRFISKGCQRAPVST